MTPEFSFHAARRVLQRDLPGAKLLDAATRAAQAGIGAVKPEKVYVGRFALVLQGNTIVTAWEAKKLEPEPKRGGRRNRRNKSQRNKRRQAQRQGQA